MRGLRKRFGTERKKQLADLAASAKLAKTPTRVTSSERSGRGAAMAASKQSTHRSHLEKSQREARTFQNLRKNYPRIGEAVKEMMSRNASFQMDTTSRRGVSQEV
jgi:hypothetical protein